jgi:hypothetical protein
MMNDRMQEIVIDAVGDFDTYMRNLIESEVWDSVLQFHNLSHIFTCSIVHALSSHSVEIVHDVVFSQSAIPAHVSV